MHEPELNKDKNKLPLLVYHVIAGRNIGISVGPVVLHMIIVAPRILYLRQWCPYSEPPATSAKLHSCMCGVYILPSHIT